MRASVLAGVGAMRCWSREDKSRSREPDHPALQAVLPTVLLLPLLSRATQKRSGTNLLPEAAGALVGGRRHMFAVGWS